MSGNVRPFEWNGRRVRAAEIVAEGQLSEADIARAVGITDRQLRRWKLHPSFAIRVGTIVEELRQAVAGKGITERENRVAALNDRWRRMQRVIDERAESPDFASVPGWTTGLLVHQLKGVGKGDDFQLVDEFAVDTGLLKELRAHEEQAAKELGQWVEKADTSGRVTVRVEYADPDSHAPPSA